MEAKSTNKKNWVKPDVQRLNINKDTYGGFNNTPETTKGAENGRRIPS